MAAQLPDAEREAEIGRQIRCTFFTALPTFAAFTSLTALRCYVVLRDDDPRRRIARLGERIIRDSARGRRAAHLWRRLANDCAARKYERADTDPNFRSRLHCQSPERRGCTSRHTEATQKTAAP
jgi:hypothetical protein